MNEPVSALPDPPLSSSESAVVAGAVSPWVLVEITRDPAMRWVLAEGAQPRRFTRLSRSRVAGSSTVAQQLPSAIAEVVLNRVPYVKVAYPPGGNHMRIMVVPVLGPASVDPAVMAVQVWAGPRARATPARPLVGTMVWQVLRTGVGLTSPALEVLLDSGATQARSRSLPDLMRHFEQVEDRAGLLGLFDPSRPMGRWSGTAVTAGVATGARRNLFLAARSVGHGPHRMVRAVVTDITDGDRVAEPAIATRVMRALPIKGQHGIGLIDVRTGLVHEWLRPGPAPLQRWIGELPVVHPDDVAELAATRARLLDGVGSASGSWRLRFDDTEAWVTVTAQWTVLTREHAPQAMLDIRVTPPAVAGDPDRSRAHGGRRS
ncbi:GAF domain-containing protein [Nocardia noduli]|uniref:GAF domain-containing protein n=1 Tax=Nocardia noduli TaxID=2815722 RepID=UPI001C24F336|nr:GAF domain-containing protein [Nocardia noduli]